MTPYYSDDSVQVFHGDCLDVLAGLPDNSVDAVVTDPPYGLEFMGKAWDKFDRKGPAASFENLGEVLGGYGPDSARGRSPLEDKPRFSTMGPRAMRAFGDWCELWTTECLRVLKPGGHLLAFGGTRTWHRLACAVEDAGFEVRDSIAWLYGSGFPKSLDVSKAIDKRPGVARHAKFAAHLAERRNAAGMSRADVSEHVVGTRTGACWNWEHHQFPEAKWWPALRDLLALDDVTWGPVIAEAEREVTREATRAASAGDVISFDQRSSTERERRDAPATPDAARWQGWGTALKPAFEPVVVARKPLIGTVAANILAHGTGALNIDGCRIEGDDAPEGRLRHGGGSAHSDSMSGPLNPDIRPASPAGRWPANVVLDETQAAGLDQQSGTLTSGANPTRRGADGDRNAYGTFGGQEDANPARGVDSGGASRFMYVAKADASERVRINGVAHPTVKPLALMRWLVRLITPPGGTILEPFAGSGTTVEAAILEGFHCIAIEREADYLPLITQRINRRRDPVQAVKGSGEDGGLFDLLAEDGGAA